MLKEMVLVSVEKDEKVVQFYEENNVLDLINVRLTMEIIKKIDEDSKTYADVQSRAESLVKSNWVSYWNGYYWNQIQENKIENFEQLDELFVDEKIGLNNMIDSDSEKQGAIQQRRDAIDTVQFYFQVVHDNDIIDSSKGLLEEYSNIEATLKHSAIKECTWESVEKAEMALQVITDTFALELVKGEYIPVTQAMLELLETEGLLCEIKERVHELDFDNVLWFVYYQ